MALRGNDRDNYFFGTRFDDEVFGYGGDDTIDGSPGADTIDGGDDVDTVTYVIFNPPYPGMSVLWVEGTAVDVDLERAVQHGGLAEGDVLINVENVTGSVEGDTIRGNAAENLLAGQDGDDIIDGRDGNDELHGGLDNDQLIGGIGNDLLFGADDNDTLIGGVGADLLDGGTGTDTANYLSSSEAVIVRLDNGTGTGGDAAGDVLLNIENVVGSNFADTLTGSAGTNLLAGGLGNDILAGLAGGDTLNGGLGIDTATYAASNAFVFVDLASGGGLGGDATNDSLISIENLIGSNFADSLFGNSGANTLDGRAGADVLTGRGGNDIYLVDNPADQVVESAGQGNDEVRANTNYTLAANQEVETLRTVDDASTVGFNLSGNEFANQIIGNAGNNALFGDAGADVLIGGRGTDIMRGGTGADTFLWQTENDSGTVVTTMDIVVDFDPLAGDRIDLSQIDADPFTAGNQAFTFIGAAAFSGTPGEVNFVQQNGETIIQINTDTAPDIEMGIRIVGLITLDASMFVL